MSSTPSLRVWSLALLLVACGGERPRNQAPSPALPDGRGVYTLRLNPPPCLSGRPELHAELKTPQGFERVALESSEEEEDTTLPVLAALKANPRAEVQVAGVLTGQTRGYAGDHTARVLQVTALAVPEDAGIPEGEDAGAPDEGTPDAAH